MSARFLALAVIVAIVLAAVPSAFAAAPSRAPVDGWQSSLTSRQVADAVAPIARRAWPGSACAGRERVKVDNAWLGEEARAEGMPRGQRLLGYAVGAPFL